MKWIYAADPFGKNFCVQRSADVYKHSCMVLFNMSDVAVVGKFAGAIALGAVGSTSILVTLFTGILLGLASGVNALTALHIGSKDDEGLKRTVHTAVIICLAGGILITVFGILFSHNILALMNTKDELIDGAVLYLRIYLLGMPALGYITLEMRCLALPEIRNDRYIILLSQVL